MTPRRARRADISAMAAILAQWEAEQEWLPDPEDAAIIAGFIEDACDGREIWDISDDALAYASINPEIQKLGALYAASRGKGTGKRILDKVKRGWGSLWLTVHAPNTEAQWFYRCEGFLEGETLPGMEGKEGVPLRGAEWTA